MFYFKRELKVVAVGTAVCSLVVFAAAALMGKLGLPVILGAVFGSVFSCLKFILLSDAVIKSSQKPPHKAKAYMTLHYYIRFVLTAVAVAIAAAADYLDFTAAVLPMLSVRIAVSFLPLVYKKEGSD